MEIAAIDLSVLKNNSMGDDEFVSEMLHIFVSQGALQLQKISELCVDGFCTDWVEETHALKGAAAIVGAELLRKSCATAQEMETAPAADRREIYEKIKMAYQDAYDYLVKENLYDPSPI